MKKTIAIIAVSLLAVASTFAQGTVSFGNGTQKVSTNSVAGGTGLVPAFGAGSYYFALFYTTTTPTGSTTAFTAQNGTYVFNIAGGGWTFGALATNSAAAGKFVSTSADANNATAVAGLPLGGAEGKKKTPT
jgi:hypothetical protein